MLRTSAGLMVVVTVVAGMLGAIGCADKEQRKSSATQPISRYQSLGIRPVPDYLKGTIYERANLENTRPFLVSSYGLLGELRGTGDNSAIASKVREYIVKELQRTGYGTVKNPTTPEQVLRNPKYAIVRVDGFIPPGARPNDRFDVLVSVPEDSYTTSLSNGELHRTSLKVFGADPNRPGGSVNSYAIAEGPVFVNPQYALTPQAKLDVGGRKSLRYGVVMDGGMNSNDNPLIWRVRDPQYSLSRAIEKRINQRFQQVADKVGQLGQLQMAQAMDDAIISVSVPRIYRGDWVHFSGVVKHLYLESNPAYLALMAEKLADAAVKPDAPLENISYAWEGIGQPANMVLVKLMQNSSPEIQYAAARAAAFIGDEMEQARLLLAKIAKTPEHPFRLNAVKTLGDLPPSSETNHYLRQLINSDNNQVRIEAYRSLTRNGDPSVFTSVIKEQFVLDMVPSSGAPIIYATRRGIPRIAIFGMRQSVKTPLTFSAIDSRLTISAAEENGPVTIFYRADKTLGDNVSKAVKQTSRAELADVIARLGGKSTLEETPFEFGYADVVSLVQEMHAAGKITAEMLDGQQVSVTLVIEEQTGVTVDDVMNAPLIPEPARRQDDRPDVTSPRIPDKENPVEEPNPAPETPGRKN